MGVAYPLAAVAGVVMGQVNLKKMKKIFAVFDDLFSTITNYTGSDVTSGDVTSGVISG